MTDAILVLNAGSSSIKFSAFGRRGADLDLVARGQVEGLGTAPRFIAKDAGGNTVGEKRWPAGERVGHDAAFAHIADWLRQRGGGEYRLAAVGHRVAHGGSTYVAPTLVDAEMIAKVESLVPLAPLHLPANLAAIRAVRARSAQLPQVACFDTAMHRTFPRVEQMFALPKDLEDEGVRRYGFHGLSYEYIASVLPQLFDVIERLLGGTMGHGGSLHGEDPFAWCRGKSARSASISPRRTSRRNLPKS
jgi:acetate kinase